MALAYPWQLPQDSAPYVFAQTQARMRDIASIRLMVLGSLRTIAEGQEALARANEVLAWRLSDPHERTRKRL